jgi:hypothetical protein
VFRDAGWPEVYFAFTDEADAKKFAEAVQAEPIGSYRGWLSQRAFEMEGAGIKELEAALPAVRRQSKLLSSDDPLSFPGRLSRGPWARIRRYDERWSTCRRAIPKSTAMWSDPRCRGRVTLLTSADWTAKERDLAISAVLRLVGMKAARPNAKEQASQRRPAR